MSETFDMSIWKFPVKPGAFEHTMPIGAKILSVAVQHDGPQLWALVDRRQPHITRRFYAYMTGQAITEEPRRFVGTFTVGGIVCHVFELD